MRLQLEQHLPVSSVPQAHGLVVTAGSEQLAVLAEGDTVDGPRVPGQCFRLLAVGPGPELDVIIKAGAGKDFAVGAEGESVNEVLVALQLGRCLLHDESPVQSR